MNYRIKSKFHRCLDIILFLRHVSKFIVICSVISDFYIETQYQFIFCNYMNSLNWRIHKIFTLIKFKSEIFEQSSVEMVGLKGRGEIYR